MPASRACQLYPISVQLGFALQVPRLQPSSQCPRSSRRTAREGPRSSPAAPPSQQQSPARHLSRPRTTCCLWTRCSATATLCRWLMRRAPWCAQRAFWPPSHLVSLHSERKRGTAATACLQQASWQRRSIHAGAPIPNASCVASCFCAMYAGMLHFRVV